MTDKPVRRRLDPAVRRELILDEAARLVAPAGGALGSGSGGGNSNGLGSGSAALGAPAPPEPGGTRTGPGAFPPLPALGSPAGIDGGSADCPV